jgi:hypothetical protein
LSRRFGESGRTTLPHGRRLGWLVGQKQLIQTQQILYVLIE